MSLSPLDRKVVGPVHYLLHPVCLHGLVGGLTAGVTYFLVVAPNHDSEENVLFNHPDPGKKVDWGEQQVRMSGDHSTSDSLLDKAITQLWGGMNYQIEHHLFPSVAHVHYPAIRKIVQKVETFSIL